MHATESDAAENVIDAFKKIGGHTIKIHDLDEITTQVEASISNKIMASLKKQRMDVRPEDEQKPVVRSVLVAGQTDSRVLELLMSMDARMSDLQVQNRKLNQHVEALQNRVEVLGNRSS